MAIRKKSTVKEEKLLNWKLLFLLSVSFLVYYPSLQHDFVNWDDIVYIMNNEMITAFNWVNVKQIFSTYFMGNYHPMILLSFLFDFHFFRFSANGYHVHNLLLHLVNATLVYTFFFHLLKKNSNVAITIALLFALHPMHVESVAWVSERKDVLYTAWYFLSLLTYLFYLQRGKKIYYFLALIFFILSCLSKAQAVTLPFVLILTDYFATRKFEWKVVFEKIPFFLLSLIFGIVAIFAQKANDYINPLGIPVFQSLFYAPYSLWVYLAKFLVPVYQTGVYDYPLSLEGTMPYYIYLSPLIFLFLIAVVWITWKNYKYITFGLLFFIATIFPVLQFLPVGGAIVAERYTYIPYIGLSCIVAIAFWEYRSNSALKYKNILTLSGIIIILVMISLTWNRTLVWKDSITFWTDVIEKNPVCVKAYYNRAAMFNEKKEYDKAVKDLTDGLKIDSNDAKKLNFYSSRAFIYKKMGKYDLALIDYSNAIKKNPEYFNAYLDRGILYTDQLGKYNEGISDFKKFLQNKPEDINGNMNLGIAYYKKNDFDSAKLLFSKSIVLNPANGNAHSLLTFIYYKNKDYLSAYKHGLLAQKYGVNVDSSLMIFLQNQIK